MKNLLLSVFISLVTSNTLAEPLPTPAPAVIHGRDQCNSDNCLRALRNHSPSASSFCTTYTQSTNTATSAIPTYATSACGTPSQLSSACSCLVTPVATACPPGIPNQVVQYPGFECATPTGYNSQTEGPWTITDKKATGYPYGPEGDIYCGNNQYAYEGNAYAYFYGYLYDGDQHRPVAFNGLATLTQNITFCPTRHYAFSAYVGFFNQTQPGQIFNTSVTVTLDGVTIVPTQLTCSSASNCNLPARGDPTAGYRQISSTVITPAKTSALLKILLDFSSSVSPLPPLYDTIVDSITLTSVS